jgi:thiosulfate/3-mercaptopyruvate sulfurtransferase
VRIAHRPSLTLRILAFSLIIAASQVFSAASPRDGMLVTTAWLAQHLDDPTLVLLHVGTKGDYAAGHIRGARFVSLPDIAVSGASGLALEMPAADDLRSRLERLGISDASRIVVYYGKDWVSPTTRVIFTLDYAGLGTRTSLLDGGMGEWVKSGHELTTDVPTARSGSLSALKINPIVVDAAYVRDHLKSANIAVVDGRASVLYDGVETGGSMENPHRTGHIAGAHSVPFTAVTDDQLKLRSAAELETIFTKAGVKPGDTVIGYCHIGQQATAMLFAARSLGHPVLLYDGSFEDWSRHPDYPVENPSKKDHQ